MDEDEKEQAIIDAQIKSQEPSKKGKFSAFLSTAEDLDQKVKEDADFAKTVDGDESLEAMNTDDITQPLDFDSDEIDIEFEFEGAIRERDAMKHSGILGANMEDEMVPESFATQDFTHVSKEQRLQRIRQAKAKYGPEFFRKFSYVGPVKEQMTQI